MNTEKIEKLKKSLSNSKIPADLKPKIESEIKRLESLDAKQEVKEEAKEEAKEVVAKKPRAKRVATKKATAKPSQTRKPKRTAMSLAKEIRKEGESWNDARARASKMMKEETKTVSKKVESELDKLSKLVRSKKELRGQIGRTNLLIDAKRKAKPMGRRISKDGNVYYENRANRTDKGTFGKYHLAEGGGVGEKKYNMQFNTGKARYVINTYDGVKKHKDGSDFYDIHIFKTKPMFEEFQRKLIKEGYKYAYAEGGYLTDPNFGNFQTGVFAKGGGVRTINGREYSYGRNWTNDHNLTNKSEEHEVNYTRKKRFELGGVMATDLAGHTGGGDAGLNAGMPLNGFSNTAYTGLVGETGAMSSGEMFMAGGSIDTQEKKVIYYRNKLVKMNVGKDEPALNFSIKLIDMLLDEELVSGNEKPKKGTDSERKILSYRNKLVKMNVGKDEPALDFAIKIIDMLLDGELVVKGKLELGGGLPSGVSQSYMITESLGNPAQHFAKGGGVGKMYYHILEYGDYGNIGYQGYYDTLEEAQKQVKKLSDYFPNQTFEIFADKSRKEPPITTMAKGGGVRTINGKEYSYGRNWTNDHEHTNKGEEHEVNYTRKGKFLGVFNDGGDFQSGVYATGGGVEDDSPKIYVADLEAYNNGRLSGVWLDLTDYSDADELMEAINDFLKTSGGEEYAIHDVENIPSNIYSEYMGQRDFEELYEMIDLAKENNLPLSVVQEVVSQYDASAVDEFQGRYDDAEDFAQQLVDDVGIESFTDFEYYLYITDTDRRLLSQDMADSYVDDIKDEDGGNRLIEEAGLDVEEYEEAESDRQEEMLDEAREIVYDEYYNNWMEGLSDPYYFLVEEQGMYDAESFANANFVRIDFEKLADALEQDYTYIYDGASLYVFNIR